MENSNVSVEIRPLGHDDLKEIITLYNNLEFSSEDRLTLEQAEKLFNIVSQYPFYWIYAAIVNNQIIGTFCLHLMYKFEHRGAPYGIIDSVVVAPPYQGKGVGTIMMRFAIEQCRFYQCYKVTLSSNIKRYQAHEFYNKLGFARHGYSFILPLSENQ